MQETYRKLERLYFLPIGGTAMASLAGLLQLAGHRVSGVDSQLYPPMSTVLGDLGVPVRLGYDPDRLPDDIDRVIIGNALPRSNPEVSAVLERRLPHLAQAEAVAHYLLAEGRSSIVAAGTHGKTTTSAMVSWILETSDTDPSYLVGGMLPWSRRSFRLGHGPWMVIEGDEYNTAFFDRGPKFLHYRPHIFLLGPVEHDHADIYRDLDAVLTAFRAGTAQVPRHGRVVVNTIGANAFRACRDTSAPIIKVGRSAGDDLRLISTQCGVTGSLSELEWQGRRLELQIPMAGRHNAENAAMALAAAVSTGVEIDSALGALSRFPGVARRLEELGTVGGVTVVDDFAHHPTALGVTISAARQRWPGRRLVVAYEPRSLTAARAHLAGAYVEALREADVAMIAAPYHRGRLSEEELIDRSALAEELRQLGCRPLMPDPDADPVETLLPELCEGDLVMGCSSGDFGGFHRALLAALSRRASEDEG